MKKIYMLFVVVCCTVLFAGCDKEDDSAFTGRDNFISAFALTVEEGSLSAAISGDSIVINTVESRKLKDAKASLTLSENAEIYPDPEDVSDWDNNRTFVVTSYNGEQRIYQYVVKKERPEAVKKANFRLTTQTEVDDFATLGVELLDGNLTIGTGYGESPTSSDDPIKSLAALSKLTEIKGTITLYQHSNDDMLGFKNLVKVGSIVVPERTGCPNALILPKLETVFGDISVSSYSGAILHTVYLPHLQRVEGDLHFDGLRVLTSFVMPELQIVLGTLHVYGNGGIGQLASLSFPKLELVGGEIDIAQFEGETINLPILNSAGGLLIKSCSSLKKITCPSLEQLMGNAAFDQNAIIEEISFGQLTDVENLEIRGLTTLSRLYMPKLKRAKNLTLSYLPKLNDLKSLSTMEEIQETLTLQNLTGLTETFAIPSTLKKINTLAVGNLPGLNELDLRGTGIKGISVISDASEPFKLSADNVMEGSLTLSGLFELAGMREIKGNVTLICTESDALVKQLSNTEKIGGDFKLTYTGHQGGITLPMLKEIAGLCHINSNVEVKAPELIRVDGELICDLNSGSTTVREFSLPKLKSVGGNFSVYTQVMTTESLTPPVAANAEPLQINMPSLTTINGILKIYRIPGNGSARLSNTLINLDGFAALTTLRGVDIQKQGALKSYAGLKNALRSFTVNEWKLFNNGYKPSYQDMLDGKFTNQ